MLLGLSTIAPTLKKLEAALKKSLTSLLKYRITISFGRHYEDDDLVYSKIPKEKFIELSYESFCKNLEMFRKNFDIKTICMHGSPCSKYDNKIIWEKYNYKDLGGGIE
jgi:hypothetical protein